MSALRFAPLAALLWASAALAAEPPPREIAVTGDAEVRVAPDQVLLTLAAETADADLGRALGRTDEAVKRLLALARKFGVEPRHVQTQEVTIAPRYKEYTAEIVGYTVHKGVVVCLRDLSRFDAFLAEAIRAGANRVEGVEFQNTELRKYRDQARQLATRAAKEKATAMAGELGQKLGRPRTISEQQGGGVGRAFYGNDQRAAGGAGGASAGFSAGEIGITASVAVTFELAD